MTVAVAVVVMRIALLLDGVLDASKVLDLAGDGDGALVIEAVLLLGLLEQPRKQRVVQIHDGDHEPLLVLAHPYGHAPLRQQLLLLPPEARQVQQAMMVVVVVVVTHLKINKCCNIIYLFNK